MAEPFLGEIRIFTINFAPKGWAMCNGQFLPINQNQGLFSLLGTTYGGDGRTTFALPDLRGRVPIHMGNGFTQGQKGGEQNHTLTISEMPQHIHFLNATNNTATATAPSGSVVQSATPSNSFGSATNLVPMSPAMVGNVGGSQPHVNMQPYLTLTFCIALQGIFPSSN